MEAKEGGSKEGGQGVPSMAHTGLHCGRHHIGRDVEPPPSQCGRRTANLLNNFIPSPSIAVCSSLIAY